MPGLQRLRPAPGTYHGELCRSCCPTLLPDLNRPTAAARPTAAHAVRALPLIGPPLPRWPLVRSVLGLSEAWNPISGWLLLDSRSVAPSDWMWVWREGRGVGEGGAEAGVFRGVFGL